MKDRIYFRFGKRYHKIEMNWVIADGAMQSWCGGELMPITNADGNTIGNTPANFSPEREFYNPID